jgi:CubicO group peptidase (beta-lactamase class C family)
MPASLLLCLTLAAAHLAWAPFPAVARSWVPLPVAPLVVARPTATSAHTLPRANPADTLPRATPAQVGMSEAGLAQATAALQAQVDAGELAGVVAAVMRDGRLVHQVALGVRDVEAGDPMPADALFRMYSMTRPVTSVAILMLHDEGRLDVDDPLVRWLPRFAEQEVLLDATAAASSPGGGPPETRPRVGEITLAHLLTHTSGIGSRSSALYRAHQVHGWDRTLEEVVDRVAQLPLFEDPGTRFRYGMHAEILGRVIEVASGQPLEDFLRERIFEPLGMRDAVFRVQGERASRLATVHRAGSDGVLRPHSMEAVPVTGDRRLVSAGVGLVASTEDFLRFGQFLLDDGVVDGVRLLSPEAARMARENAVPPALLPLGRNGYWAGSGWSLGGFAVALEPAAYAHPVSPGEFWWDGSAGTRFWIDPVERLVVVVNAQISPAGGGGFREGFRARVDEALEVRHGSRP